MRCPRACPPDVTFDGRSRRPPRDLPNAALSYGYAILLSECVGALHAAGLESSLGIAHAPTDKRPSLALDLMEQFRPLLVDQTVMALLRTRKLRPEHGFVEAEAGGVWLGDACEDVDLAADFRADEAGGQADAPLMVADEGHLREEPTGVRSPCWRR